MRVGIVGPIWFSIPPLTYGGTEEVVYNLVQGLSAQGHDVTLFGPKTARIAGKVVATVERPLREQHISWDDEAYTRQHLETAFSMAGEFDILHVHLNRLQDYHALELAEKSKTPVVFTIHFKLPSKTFYPKRYALLDQHRHLPFISISNSQRSNSRLNFVKTVYNGIDLGKFAFSQHAMDYLVWLGRVHPDKGTKEAIVAAKRAGKKLYVMGLIDETVSVMKRYYKEEVLPLIDGKEIIWLGPEQFLEKTVILGGANAFLNPISWEEPFGLVMVEAQAVGTPVISFAMGAAPEIIIDGKTGYLVDTLDEMVLAIAKTDQIDRMACRKNVEERFSLEQMVRGYEGAYETGIANWPYTS